MTQTVLSDPVLTQKVLRLANSGMYSAFGQSINTVSKAVLVLGTEAIGHLALGLKLIEELANSSPDSTHRPHRDGKGGAGRDGGAAGGLERGDARSRRSGGLLDAAFAGPHDGHLLHAGALGRLQAHGGGGEDAAAPTQLGLSLERIGRATAEHWGLPRNLIAGMRRIEPGERGECFQPRRLAGRAVDHVLAVRRLAVGRRRRRRRGGARAGQQLSRRCWASSRTTSSGDRKSQGRGAAADLSIAPLAKPAEKRAKALAATRMRAAGNKILISGVSDMRDVLARPARAR
jgi:hypothetical protein